MAGSPSGLSDNSTQDLLGGWNLGGEPELDDSLLNSLPSREPRSEAAAGSRSWTGPRSEPDPQEDLCRAFAIVSPDDPRSLDDGSVAGDEDGEEPSPSSGENALVQLPRPGEEVGGFQIVGELGRGAFARVYLAEQTSLGHRLVALKVSKAEGDEPQILARLQHTHIVPIHSVHDDAETGLRLMCMPYFGGANLAQILEAAGARLAAQATGRSLVEALDLVSQRVESQAAQSLGPGASAAVLALLHAPASRGLRPVSRPARSATVSRFQSLWSQIRWPKRLAPREKAEAVVPEIETESAQPARQFLRQANFIHAAVWIVARLAEGLDHAHSRGLLHRDLKPSNILIANDGTPMLLDFNLATESQPDEGAKAMLGGTLPYMAPEHLDAFNPEGTTAPDAVDERSDLYALGLILFEMIAGEHPFPEAPPGTPLLQVIRRMSEQRRRVPSLRAACAQVPWSLDAIVSKCLAPDPQRRYGRARDLAEDLRRFLEDLPLKHTPEPSFRERLAKWVRRHPRICGSTSIVISSIVLLLIIGVLLAVVVNNLHNVSAQFKYRTFQTRFDECQLLLNTTSGPTDHLGRGIAEAEQAIDLEELSPSGQWRGDSWVGRLSASQQENIRERTVELILSEGRARTALAERRGSEADQRQALKWAVRWLDRAERLDRHPPPTLFSDRARYLAALGLADRAALDRKRAAETPLVTGRDFALLGTERLARHDLPGAEEALQRAVVLDPRAFWPWFLLGTCHFDQGRFLEAAGDFGICTALEPKFAWSYLNRGLALARAGKLLDALKCDDRALEANPRFIEALVNRALIHLELNHLADAECDLKQAVALGRNDATILYILGEVLARLGRRGDAERLFDDLLADDPDNPVYRVTRGFSRLSTDPEGARSDLSRALKRDPRNARAHYGLALLVQGKDRRAALDHVARALDADPDLVDALQLRALLRARLGDLAAIDDVERLIQSATPHRLYNGACALAVLAETANQPRLNSRAFALLGRALDFGFPPDQAAADSDWKALRDRTEFRELLQKAAARRAGPLPRYGGSAQRTTHVLKER
jgi:serine/threonine protein kinase/tetratricopeptide (TPR) repeat protein